MLDRDDKNAEDSLCLILAHQDMEYAAAIARAFRRMGWDVYAGRSGLQARRLARRFDADAIVLGTDLPQESGWLTCDKLTREQPFAKVILVGDNLSPRNRELALFVGARALVCANDGLASLAEELCGAAAG